MKTLLLTLLLLPLNTKAQDTLQFADRYYIASTLSELFGPESKSIVTENILKNGNVFGGPCDVYEQIRTGENKFASDESIRCFNGKQEFDYPMRANASLLRESWMIKACTSLVKNTKTFSYFKKHHLVGFNARSEQIFEIQRLFDPNAKLNKPLNEYYFNKMKTSEDSEKKLRMLILEICTYPTWQLI